MRGERPRRRRITKQRDELAPILIELHPIPHKPGPHHKSISHSRWSVSGYRNDFATGRRMA
jgi:hypothetical protein